MSRGHPTRPTQTVERTVMTSRAVISSPRAIRFKGIHHEWRIDRSSRAFKVRVVEPGSYEPRTHGKLFTDIVTAVLNPPQRRIERHARAEAEIGQEPFDLITFPEAFAPAAALLDVIRSLEAAQFTGCFHVGLRPSDEPEQHLFAVGELEDLVRQLSSISTTIETDLAAFQEWLSLQQPEHVFNVGCFFAVDSEGLMRVCLHPKLVSSHYEVSPLPERTMKEANLLTLITLLPIDPQLLSVTIQPLICSDVLSLPTNIPGGAPMEAVTRYADCFGKRPPDHVDIVSVATCTPQPQGRSRDGTTFYEWHEQFRGAFRDAATGANFARHHFSVIVLSNFRTLKEGEPGGLSGAFLPVPPKHPYFHADVDVSTWGRPKNQRQANNNWSRPEDDALADWDNRGFIASLNSSAHWGDAPVKIFAFTIPRLPRELSLWERTSSLSECKVLVGSNKSSSPFTLDAKGGNDVR